jgi:hypothetical protein
MNFYNGDVYDIGQSINGVSRFIRINGSWYYYSERLMCEYEYDSDELGKLIADGLVNGDEDIQFLGNIFSHIEGCV